ncbi:MAG: DNA primase [Candidatus Paceibacterales bacterium]
MLTSPIDEIKSKLDIVEVIGSYIKLRKAGANYRALCPFHSEKNPSLFVSPARQIWHCFGCSKGGDIFGFIKEIEGVEFGDALRLLAQKAGVELRPQRKESAIWRTEKQRSYEICELATKFFEKQLEGSSKGNEAKKYLLTRGIKEASIRKWRLGWAPDTWQGLSDFLASKGYKREEIEKVGLVIKNEQGSYYDRFRGRVIFPIFGLHSQVIGFGGRIFQSQKSKVKSQKSEVAKYVNTPNTLLYDKSKVLYGLDKAKVETRKKDFCILVEGYIDVILAHQIGKENTVATSGTSLTPYQLTVLKRYSDNLSLAFDMDIAGDTATKRGIDLAQARGFNLKIISLPENKDPADVISKKPKEFEKLIDNSLSILDYYFQNAFSKFDKNKVEGKKEISKILLPVIKRIPNKIEQSFWVQQLAEKLEVKEKDVEEEMRKAKIESPDLEISDSEPQNLAPKKTRKELLEERLMTLILKSPQHSNLIDKKFLPCFSVKAQEILVNFQKQKKLSPELTDFLNYLSLKAEIEEIEEEEILPEIQFCLKEIQSLEIKNKLGQISQEIKKAEGKKDLKKIEKLTREFNQYAKKITEH